MASKQGKMQNLINYRMRITLVDGRQMTGQMLAFDKVRYPPQSPLPLSPTKSRLSSHPSSKPHLLTLSAPQHMNIVLADTEEFRKTRRPTNAKSAAPAAPGSAAAGLTEEKRTLGLLILRGTNIVSCSVEGPPPSDPSSRLGTSAPGGGLPASMQAGGGISRPAGRGIGMGGLGGPPGGGMLGGPPPGAGFGGPPQGLPQMPGRGGPPPGFGGGPPGGGGGFGRGAPPPGFGGR